MSEFAAIAPAVRPATWQPSHGYRHNDGMTYASATPRPTAVKLRFRQLGLVFPLAGLVIVGAGLFVLFIIGMPLIFFTIGIPLEIGVVYLTRVMCNVERAIFRRAFGVDVDKPYRQWPRGHPGSQLLALTKDASVWRDFAWQAVNSTLGAAVYATYLVLLGGAVSAVLHPFLYMVWPETFDNFYGLLTYRSLGGAWAFAIPIAVGHLVLWWTCGNLVVNAYAKLAGLLLRSTHSAELEQRVVELTTSRDETVDSSAAELRRIERDLHDGAQARLVALGISLGMAEQLIKTDTDGAAALLAEARENSGAALSELRDLVRGIHPPVLSDRGISGAVEALALKHSLPITVYSDLPGRVPAPVESAMYFAIAEVLTNVAKYSRANTARVRIGYYTNRLGVTVHDDGVGGVHVTPGGGLEGLTRRLAAFDGTLGIASPPGGPTTVTLEIPCELNADSAQ